MNRAAVILMLLLAGCLFARAESEPATDASTKAQDLVVFGTQDNARGQFTTALIYFNEALALQSNLGNAWAGKARALDGLKRYDDARSACEQALALEPNSPLAWAVQGRILFDLKRYSEALIALDKSLDQGGQERTVYLWKGQTLDSLGRHDDALAAYAKAAPPVVKYKGGITGVTHSSKALNTEETTAEEGYEDTESPISPAWRYPGREFAVQPSQPNYDESYEPDYTDWGYNLYINPGFHHKRHRDREDNGIHFVQPYRGVVPLFQPPVVAPLQQGATGAQQNGSALPPIETPPHGGGGHHGGGHGRR